MRLPLSAKMARAVFGNRNNHPFLQVLAWRLWRSYTQKKYPISSFGGGGREIRSRGMEVLGHSNVDQLTDTVTKLLSREPIKDGYCGLPRSKNSTVAPLIYRVLEEHRSKIEAYFGSYFRVNWFELQKIVEGYDGAQDAGTSFGYHTDDVPDDVVKLFVYLTDTTESSGAFRAFDYAVSDKLIRSGMLKSSAPGKPRVESQRLISKDMERNLMVIEGKKGTVFIFDNNLIHKGTLPRQGSRIHVSMELMPSVKPLSYADFSRDCDQPIKEYFPRNPFRFMRQN